MLSYTHPTSQRSVSCLFCFSADRVRKVEARARLRWALGQLGDASTAAAAAAASAGLPGAASDTSARGQHAGGASTDDAVFRDTSGRATEPLEPAPAGSAGDPRPGLRSPPPQRASPSFRGVRDGEGLPTDEAAQEEAKEFREPNWRSMVPVLFPPGWRDRELAAGAAAATRVGNAPGGGGGGGGGADDGDGEGAVENTAAVGERAAGAAGAHEALYDGSPSERWPAAGSGGGGRGEADRAQGQEGSGDGRVGDVALAGATTAGARPRRAEEAGAGAVLSVEEADFGVHGVPGEAHTALDHLTEEERSFAYLGGVETEYGEWLSGGNDDVSHYDGLEMPEGGGAASGGYDGVYYQMLEQGRHRAAVSAEVVREVPRRRPAVPGRSIDAPTRTPRATESRAAGARRSQPVVGSRVAARGRLQGSDGVSPGQRLSVRVPGPRASATAPGSRTRGRRSLPLPRSANTAANTDLSFSAFSQRRAAATTTLKRGRLSGGGGGGGGGAVGGGRVGASGAAARRDRGIVTGASLQRSRSRHQSAPAPPSAGIRRVAVGGSMISTGSASAGEGYPDAGVSILRGAKTRPQRAWRSSGSGRLDAGTASSKSRSAALGRSGTTSRKDAVVGHRPAARRPPKSGEVPAGTAAAAKRSPALPPPAATAGLGGGRGRGVTREHVSRMRRRKERSGLGSSVASSRAAAGVGGDRWSARGGGGLTGGAVNSSTCSSKSRAWKP